MSKKKSKRYQEREKQASSAYKRDLEKFFQGGSDVPDRFKELADGLKPDEGSEEAIWQEAVQGLRDAEGFREFVTAVNEFVKAGHQLPGDEELLKRILDHPSERMVQLALEQFARLNERPGLERPGPLENRIKTIRAIAEDPRTHALLDQLEADLP